MSTIHCPICYWLSQCPAKGFAIVYGCLIGLGRLRVLDDELLVQVLGLLPAEALARLACVNRALYCFANHEDIWRALTLEVSCITTVEYVHMMQLHTCNEFINCAAVVLLPGHQTGRQLTACFALAPLYPIPHVACARAE